MRISLSHDYTKHWRRGWTCNCRPSRHKIEHPKKAKQAQNTALPDLADEAEPDEVQQEMERSLPTTPITFNIDVTDLYNEWKQWSSVFEIYAIASDLSKKEDAVQSHNAALPWPYSAMHFQHAPWRTQEPWRGQDPLEWVRYLKTERGSKTPQTQVESTEGRWVVQRVCDEALRAGKILWLWHFGKDDKRPNRREVLFPNLKEESAPARRPWPCKTVKIARNAEMAVEEAPLLSQGTRESPTQIDHMQPSSCYRCGGRRKCGAIKSRFNEWKKLDTCRGFAAQSWKVTKRTARKGKKRNRLRRFAAWIWNLVLTGLKTAKMKRVKNLYSLPMVTVPSQRGLTNKGSKWLSTLAVGTR